jgi:hypothetical protein
MPEINTDEIDEFQRLYPLKPQDAIEQTAQYLGFMAGMPIDIGDAQPWILPNPSLLGDEQEDRYNQELVDQELEAEQYDRYPDVLDDDGEVVTRGAVKQPPRINGVIVENRDVRIAKALMGADVYAKFKAAGGRASQITLHWQHMGKFMRDRAAKDPKSGGSDRAVVEVSDGTGVGPIPVSQPVDS